MSARECLDLCDVHCPGPPGKVPDLAQALADRGWHYAEGPYDARYQFKQTLIEVASVVADADDVLEANRAAREAG